MTPPSMHRVRCLGWTRKETSKEAKLHGLAVSSSCVFTRFKFPRLFTRRYPKRGDDYGCSPPTRAGNLSAPPVQVKRRILSHIPAPNASGKLCAARYASFAQSEWRDIQRSSTGILRLAPGRSATKRGSASPPIRSAHSAAISFARSTGTRKCDTPATGSQRNT